MFTDYYLKLEYMESVFLKPHWDKSGHMIVFSFLIYPASKYDLSMGYSLGCGMRFNITKYLWELSFNATLKGEPFNSEFMLYDGNSLLVCSHLKLSGLQIPIFFDDLRMIMDSIRVYT